MRERCAVMTLALALAWAILFSAISPAQADVFFFRDRGGVMHFTNVPTDSRYHVLLPERNRRARVSAVHQVPYSIASMPPADIETMIEETAARYAVEPALVHAVVRAESDFDRLAVSPAGARGLMQLMPSTASLVGVRDVFHPRENLDGGVYYLRTMMDRFAGNVQYALAAYNAGPGVVDAYGGVPPYPETLDYIQRVFRFRQEYLRSKLERPRLALATSRAR
jgi:soluble lytic murein transglycosylase-like protein